MKRYTTGHSTVSSKVKCSLSTFIKSNVRYYGVLGCIVLLVNTVHAQTFTSTQTINVTANANYQFLVKGGAGSGKLNGDVRDPNAVSANGNWGGTGATITANFFLLAGDIVYVIPGEAAQYDHAPNGGGGGGSAVIVNRAGNFHLLVVAGGGGGGGYTEMGLGGSITNYNGIQTAAGGTGNIAGGGGGGGVGAGFGGGTGNVANGGSPGIVANHVTASAGSATNGSNGARGFGGGGGGGVANRIPSTPGGGGGGGGYIGGNGAAPSASAPGGTSYVNNTEAGFSALYMSAVAGVAGGNSAYAGNAGFVTVTVLPPPPTITSFSPLQAKPGDAVTISGTNFNTTPASNIVFFGATKATVTAANTTSLTVTVPVGATNSVISVLNTGTSLSAFSQMPFLPIFTPVKSSIEVADFAPRVNFTAGPNPGYVTMGDLDGDGKPDMAASNQADHTVSVFLNTGTSGNPTFAAGITLTTGQAPQGVAIGDIDGDGKPDMAITSYNGNLVSVFRNTSTTGNISFAAKVDIALGSCPFFVVIRDMDGDGRADMVTANKDANTVSIVLNTGEVGNISFAARVDLNTGLKPYSVTVGDLDGDGKPDVAASAFESNNMVVFRNKSTIGLVSFEARQDFAVTTPYSISTGDLDGDGKLDLATGNLSSNNISIFRNTSVAGTISFAAKSDIAIGQRIYNVAVGDLDGDGKSDLVTSNYTNNTVSILQNTGSLGTISFAPQVALATGAGPNYVSVADIDSDSKPDLLVTNFDDTSVSILRNDPVSLVVSGTLSAVNTTYGTASASPASFTVSGMNMKAGITVTPPAGYEVSQTAGGASGYAGAGTALVVGSAGNIASTTVYVRLAANNIPGSYSGNVVITSTRVTSVNLATVASTVNGASLTITANNASRIYRSATLNDAAVSTSFTATGLMNSETVGSVAITYNDVAGNGNVPGDAVGTYPGQITPSAATGGTFTASNYVITYVAGNVSVTPAALTITAANASKTYGTTLTGGAGSSAFTASGLQNSETIGSVTVAYATGAGSGTTAADAVGTYTGNVTASAATGGTFAASNYAITYVAGNINVISAALTITAANASKTYGTTLTGGTGSTAFTATGLVNAETIGSVSIDYTPGAGNGNTATDAVGTYTAKVTPSAATGGTFTAANYTITYSAGNIAVTPAALSITAANASRTYRSATLNDAAVSTSFTATGLLNSETIGSVAITYNNVAGNGNVPGDAVGIYPGQITPSAATGGTFTASNYVITYVAGNISVTPAALIITAANASKTYGTTLTGGTGSSAFTTSGLQNSETIGSVTIAYAAGAGSGTTAGDAVGTYTAKVTPSAATGGTFTASNYVITYVAGNIAVTPAALSITAANASRTYRSATLNDAAVSTSFTATGLLNSETIGSVAITYNNVAGNGNVPGDAVGIYPGQITPSAATGGTFTASNYVITYVAGNISVTPAALIITAANASKTYGTTLTGGTGSSAFTTSGLQNSETIGSVTIAYAAGAGSGTTAGDAVGTYTAKVIPSAATGGTFTASNYTITYSAGNIAVTPAALSITAANASKTYGATLTGGTGSTAFTATGLVNAETIGSVSIAYTAGAGNGNTATDAVGTYTAKVTPSAAAGGTFMAANYTITYLVGNIAVTPATLSITAANASKTYGTTLTGGTGSTAFTATGLVNAESIGSVSIAYTAGAGNGNTVTDAVGTYTAKVTPSAATGGTFTAANYTITYTAGNIAVTPVALSITAANASKTYGSTLTGGTGSTAFTATGLVNAETIGSVSIAYTAGAGNGNTATDAVGTYTAKVTPSAATGGTFTAANYTITYTAGNIAVTPVALSITAANASKTYGSTLTGGTGSTAFTATGLVNAETIGSVSIAYTAGAGNGNTATDAVGTYTAKVTPSAATGGTFTAANYTITYTAGNIAVTPVALSITAANASKTYGTTLTGGTGSTAFTATGLVNAETIGSVSIAYTAGAGNGNTATDAVGTYTAKVTPSAATGGTFVPSNYGISYVPGNLNIQKAPLRITAASQTRAAGLPNPVFTANYAGFVNGETASNLTILPVFSTTATSSSSPGIYPISGSGAVSPNYTFTYIDGVLTIFAVANVAPTLSAIPNQTICYTSLAQSISLSGISPGPEANQLTNMSVSSSNSSLFRTLSVTAGSNGTGMLSYSVNPDMTGTASITVTVKDDGGTSFGGTDSFSRTFSITVNSLPRVSISSDSGTDLSKGYTAVLTATGGTSYTWTNASGIVGGQNTAVLTVRPSQTTTYVVTATNAAGCSSSQSFTINVLADYLALEATNIMTPNGDGRNDALVIKNLDLYPNNTLKIFDRAGRQVYVQQNYANDWVGTLDGSPLSEDTYYYILEFGVAKRIKGFVTIVRSR